MRSPIYLCTALLFVSLMGYAQLRTLSFTQATVALNPSFVAPSVLIAAPQAPTTYVANVQTVVPIQLSVIQVATYPNSFTVRYGVADQVGADWFWLKWMTGYISYKDDRTVYDALPDDAKAAADFLMYNDFQPPTGRRLRVKLDFRFSTPNILGWSDYTPLNNTSPVKASKYLIIN